MLIKDNETVNENHTKYNRMGVNFKELLAN